MDFIPSFKPGLLNGWLFFAGYLVVFGITMFSFSKPVRARLYDRSLWTKKHRILSAIGKLFSLSNMVLFVLNPLRFDSPYFILGVILWALGLIGLVTALWNFNSTPLDVPVTRGIYKISRNPQIFSIYTIFTGICFMIGSGLCLLLLVISVFFLHNLVLAEEESCLQQYGNSYRDFMTRVPRYFLFF